MTRVWTMHGAGKGVHHTVIRRVHYVERVRGQTPRVITASAGAGRVEVQHEAGPAVGQG